MKKMTTKELATYGIYLSLFLLMAFVPNFGFIKIGVIELTIMLVPICIISIHLGFKGAIFGFVMFGLTSFLRGMAYGSAIIAQFGILDGGVLTLMMPRVIIGLIIALFIWLLDKYLPKFFLLKTIAITTLSPILNTLVVLAFITIWSNHDFIYWFAIISVQFVFEILFTIVVGSIVLLCLKSFIESQKLNSHNYKW